MPEIRNCPRCGKIFNYMSNPICGRCIEDEEDEFKRVKGYVYDNPGANMFEVAEITEVSIEKIMRFLREERLEISGGDGNVVLECERCGRAIKTGRFCEPCKDNLQTEFKKEFGLSKSSAPSPSKTKEKNKMYTATRRK